MTMTGGAGLLGCTIYTYYFPLQEDLIRWSKQHHPFTKMAVSAGDLGTDRFRRHGHHPGWILVPWPQKMPNGLRFLMVNVFRLLGFCRLPGKYQKMMRTKKGKWIDQNPYIIVWRAVNHCLSFWAAISQFRWRCISIFAGWLFLMFVGGKIARRPYHFYPFLGCPLTLPFQIGKWSPYWQLGWLILGIYQ